MALKNFILPGFGGFETSFAEVWGPQFHVGKTMPWTTHWGIVVLYHLFMVIYPHYCKSFHHVLLPCFSLCFFESMQVAAWNGQWQLCVLRWQRVFFYFMLDLDLNKSKRASFCGSPPTCKNNDPLHIAWDESVEEVKAPKAVLNWAKSVAGRAAVERLLMAHTKRLRGILMDIGHLVHFRGAGKAGKYMEHLTVGMIFIAPSGWPTQLSNPAIPNQRRLIHTLHSS